MIEQQTVKVVLTPEQRVVVRDYLSSRLVGVEQALASIVRMSRTDPTNWSTSSLMYYRHVSRFLVQCIKQLGGKPPSGSNGHGQSSIDPGSNPE